MYIYGYGVPQDTQTAIEWCQKAAGQENQIAKLLIAAFQEEPEAQYRLGLMYANAEGFSQDIPKAVAWFQKAAGQGHPEAKEQLEKISSGTSVNPASGQSIQ